MAVRIKDLLLTGVVTILSVVIFFSTLVLPNHDQNRNYCSDLSRCIFNRQKPLTLQILSPRLHLYDDYCRSDWVHYLLLFRIALFASYGSHFSLLHD